jgi:hypothetical protein
MARIAHQPGPVCLEGCEPLAGRGGGFEGGVLQCPQAARGALLGFEHLRKTRGPRPSATVAEGLPGMTELRPLFPGGPGGGKAVVFHNPQALSNVQEESLSCARDHSRWQSQDHRC